MMQFLLAQWGAHATEYMQCLVCMTTLSSWSGVFIALIIHVFLKRASKPVVVGKPLRRPNNKGKAIIHACFCVSHINSLWRVAKKTIIFFSLARPMGLEPGPRYQAALLGALACMENLMNSEPRVMSDAACHAFEKAYLTYRSALNWLARQNVQANKCRYRLRPKVHQPAHITYSYLPLNPRRYSNYLDEDFIARSKQIAARSHPLYMPVHTVMRYSIAACLRWYGSAGQL